MSVKYQSRGLDLYLERPALRFLEDNWQVSSRNTAGRCYSVSYVFGHKLQSELLVPVGLMNAAVAGKDGLPASPFSTCGY